MQWQSPFLGSSARIAAFQKQCFVIEEESDESGRYSKFELVSDGSLWEVWAPPQDGYPECNAIMIRCGSGLKEIMQCISEARFSDEMAVAASHMRWPDYEEVVPTLEAIASGATEGFQLRNVALTVAWSQIDVAYNHFGSQGLSISQIEKDYLFFKNLASRALNARELAEQRLGKRVKRRITWR